MTVDHMYFFLNAFKDFEWFSCSIKTRLKIHFPLVHGVQPKIQRSCGDFTLFKL